MWFSSSCKECKSSSISSFIPIKPWTLAGTKKNATIISTKPSKLSCIYSIFLSFPGAVHRSIWENSNTILYRQQKPLQVLYITVSNLKNDNCTGKGQFDENNNTMPLQMFYYNVRKGKFLQMRKNNKYNTDKLPQGHYKTKSKKKMKIKPLTKCWRYLGLVVGKTEKRKNLLLWTLGTDRHKKLRSKETGETTNYN